MDSNAKISGSTLRIADICTNETYTVDCDGSCNSSVCDGYACRTGECIVRTIEFVSCGDVGGGGGETGSGDNIGDGGSGGSGGNTSSSYIYSPNNFEQNDSNEINRINDLKRDAIWSAMTTNMQYYFSSNYNKALLFNETIQYQIDNDWSQDSYDFGQGLINQAVLNPTLNFDVDASSKSPSNVDRSSIPFDFTKPENQKFNELYDVLTTSPTFKKLFIDIFQDSKRFNVKFEIAEHVYEGNDPAKKEVNATTSQDPVTKNLTIKISKQILTAGTTMSQTKIENAKTILHECIHAYLFTISSNPLVGMDIAEVINTVLPTVAEQHDFMYDKMIPTMQKVLGEIRDKVTTEIKRNAVESLNMSGIPSSPVPWNWNDYFKYLSLKGLEEAAFFIDDFPKGSDKETLFIRYYIWGRNNLND